MNNKQRVNIKARLNRHLRLLKNVWFESKTFNWGKGKFWYWLSLSMIFIILIFPIYPSISNIVYTNTELEFDRSIIDESTIISSYEFNPELSDDSFLYEYSDSYVSVNTILSDDRDLAWVNEITRYEVRIWDSIASIAENFWVSKNTVLWANNMEYARELKVWEIIRVPSATWYLYKVKPGDRIENIAKEYNITVEAIEKQNGIQNGYLVSWREILLPWASKKIPVIEKPKVVETKVNKINNTKTNDNKKTNTTTKINNNTKTNTTKTTTRNVETNSYDSSWETWTYQLRWRQPQWRFAWWNCTRYVAQYKNVNWWGNANQWLRNARAKGHATWYVAKPWAIVQFGGRWYNPQYWHVWIVTWVTSTHILVSDMNYKGINVVSNRKVPIWDASIQWYIYVD